MILASEMQNGSDKALVAANDTLEANALRAGELIEAAGSELAAHPFSHQTSGAVLQRIPTPDEAEAHRRSSLARDWLSKLSAIDKTGLPAELGLQLALAKATAQRLAKEADWFWTVHDPIGLGFFGLFGPTAYCGGWYIGILVQQLAGYRLESGEAVDRYLSLVSDLAKLIEAMRLRLAGQAARGMLMPVAQLGQARNLVSSLAKRLPADLTVRADRLAMCDAPERRAASIAHLVDTAVRPALAALGSQLEVAVPGEDLGIAQYAGGEAIYGELVRHHTTLDLDPEAVHRIGQERMAGIRAAMAAIRAETGFAGDDNAYRAAIAEDPDYRAGGISDILARFDRCLADVEPLLERCLRLRPAAGHGVARLPDALASSMTFGYYQVAAGAGATGRYLFNAANLAQSGMASIPALTFHELAPGHHIHFASQAENGRLTALSKYNSFNAFNEGWAEYAATLAGEWGLYRSPQERFGRLMMDALLTSRLVVDTGLNARGWTLDEGRAYLAANGFISDSEARTEAIRYACDVPGQALAYKLGDTFLIDQRERMRAALGARFDMRDFHDAVLREGAMPLPLVAGQIDKMIATVAASQAVQPQSPRPS